MSGISAADCNYSFCLLLICSIIRFNLLLCDTPQMEMHYLITDNEYYTFHSKVYSLALATMGSFSNSYNGASGGVLDREEGFLQLKS